MKRAMQEIVSTGGTCHKIDCWNKSHSDNIIYFYYWFECNDSSGLFSLSHILCANRLLALHASTKFHSVFFFCIYAFSFDVRCRRTYTMNSVLSVASTDTRIVVHSVSLHWIHIDGRVHSYTGYWRQLSRCDRDILRSSYIQIRCRAVMQCIAVCNYFSWNHSIVSISNNYSHFYYFTSFVNHIILLVIRSHQS